MRAHVKRSAREGRPPDIPSARVRFACEAAFLVLVAVGAALMELRPLAIIILMACAWLLVALIERASSREAARVASEAAEAPVQEAAPATAAFPPVEPREAYRWLFWRRARSRLEELPSPTAALEERPARSHVRRIEAEPKPAENVEPVAAAPPVAEAPEPEREPVSAGPAVTKRPLDLRGLEEPPPPPPPPSPRPRFLRPRQPAPVAPPPPPPAREWNLWDLERKAREQRGNTPRDEEWSALFTHLRVFANADGILPKEFDGLVRESFGTLIEAA
jgi:hypothetical protein